MNYRIKYFRKKRVIAISFIVLMLLLVSTFLVLTRRGTQKPTAYQDEQLTPAKEIKKTDVKEEEIPRESLETNQPTATASTEVPTAAPPKPSNPLRYGFSEWHAFNRRIEVSKPLSTEGVFEGTQAKVYCPTKPLSTTPILYAVACSKSGGGYRGHMAFVEKINDDGSVWLSEMNGVGQVSMTDTTPIGGFARVSFRHVSAEELTLYQFIH